ncbi:hypothetical protein BT69DRAFT_125112 [Atractiella rhizophila]|nr:hypothetical protein BT69DRAFT_125112 [Atractiella rhizophila]
MSMYFDSQSDWQPGPGSAPPTSMSFSTPGTQMPSLHGINSRFPVNLGKIQHHPTYGAAPPPLSHLPHHNGFSYPGQHAPQSPFSTINGVSHHSQPHSQIFPQPHSQNLTHNPPIPIGSQSHHHQPPLPPPSAPPNDPRNGQGTAMTNGSLPPPSSSSASSSPHRQQQVQWRGIAANASAPFYHCRTAQHLARGGSATVTILDPNRPLKPTQGGPVAFRQSFHHFR